MLCLWELSDFSHRGKKNAWPTPTLVSFRNEFQNFDKHPISPPPRRVTLEQLKNQTQQTRVEQTNAQHSTASYHGHPSNRNMRSNSNTLKADPFKTLFSCPFQHFYLYVSLANKTYTSSAGSLSTAFMSLLTRAFDFIMVEHCVVCSSVVLKNPRHTMHKFPKGANLK